MIRTTEPVIIMTKAELDAIIEAAAKKAVAEAMKTLGQGKAMARREAVVHRRAEAGDRGLLRMPQLLDRVGLKKTVIYERIKAGTFPKPIKLGSASAWCARDVDAWIDQQARSKN